VLGRDDPHFIGDFRCDGFEHGEAGCIDTIVVGQQDALNARS
jgi:hypothetical protein